MSISKTKLIEEYRDAKFKLDHFKRLENELRIKIVEIFFPSGGEGTHTTEFKDFEVKGTIKYNYKFDQNELKAYRSAFSPEELTCIKETPSFNLTAYRKLGDDEKETIDQCIVITPGLPGLEIKEIV